MGHRAGRRPRTQALASRSGILVVSAVSLSRPWVQEEYAAMLVRTLAGRQRLIPGAAAECRDAAVSRQPCQGGLPQRR